MHDIIVLGASAGGVKAMVALVSRLPATLRAAVFVVIHQAANAPHVLPDLLHKRGTLPAHYVSDGEVIKPGHIYIAPPDWHMLIQTDLVRLTRGPFENRHRPAIDPLFRSAAVAHGSRVVGALLSGMLDDGSAGLQAIKSRSGITICQDPEEATYPDMPRHAIEQVGVDYVVTLQTMAELLVDLTHQANPTPDSDTLLQQLQQETEIAALNWQTLGPKEPPGSSSTYGCPACGGVLWEVQNGNVWQYRCRVGHAYLANALLASKESQVEDALWTALRALEERASLLGRMIVRAQRADHLPSVSHLQRQKQEAEERANLLHSVLMSGGLAALSQAHAQVPGAVPKQNEADEAAAPDEEF
jgi:two-component system chemotaxis response regulator CheB